MTVACGRMARYSTDLECVATIFMEFRGQTLNACTSQLMLRKMSVTQL